MQKLLPHCTIIFQTLCQLKAQLYLNLFCTILYCNAKIVIIVIFHIVWLYLATIYRHSASLHYFKLKLNNYNSNENFSSIVIISFLFIKCSFYFVPHLNLIFVLISFPSKKIKILLFLLCSH